MEPPPSRALATLKQVWADYQQGVATADDLITVLNAVGDLAHLEHSRLTAQAQEGAVDPKSPSYKLVLKGFFKHLEAIDIMNQELDEPGQGHFERGLAMAEEADSYLVAGHNELVQQIQDLSTVNCMFCGQENQRGSDRCQKCGRTLPPMPGESRQNVFSALQSEEAGTTVDGDAPVTENYVRLEEAVAAWRAEELGAEDLLALIEEVEAQLVAHHQDCGEQLPSLEGHDAALQAMAQTQEALEQSLAAIDKLKLAFEKEDDTYLVTGLEDFRLASDALLACYQAVQAAEGGPAPATPVAEEEGPREPEDRGL